MCGRAEGAFLERQDSQDEDDQEVATEEFSALPPPASKQDRNSQRQKVLSALCPLPSAREDKG
jgi:hypothetical protein